MTASIRTLDFYFDYLSPFAYFAAVRLPDICQSRGVELQYRPVLFAGLLNHWGQLGPAEVLPKAIHTFKTTYRYAALGGIPFSPPRFHPFVPLTALRATLRDICGDDQALVVKTLFELGWAEGRDPGDSKDIADALTAAGLDGDTLVAATREEEAKQSLRMDTEDAIARGVFGVPTMIAGDELFWGVDQLPYLELYLDGQDPWEKANPDESGYQGRAAQRPGSIGRGPGPGGDSA